MNGGVPILSIRGIRIRAHWSVLLVAGLMAWGFADGVVARLLPETSLWARWVAGLAAAVLIVASLLVHELAHSLVARARGVTVEGITLWLFGGASHLHDDWPDARTELAVSVAGPLATLALAVLLAGASVLLAATNAPAVLIVTAQWLTIANGLLFVFNLVPAFPLDGGRIFRAAMWRARGDRAAATRAAAGTARVVAFVLMGLGLAEVLLTSDVTGFWLVLIGWFLLGTSRREQQGEMVRSLLRGVRVSDAMTRDPGTIPSWMTLDLLAQQYATPNQQPALIARDLDGSIRGLVTLQALRRVPPKKRATMRAADIAIPLAAVPSAAPDEMIADVLARMRPVTEGRALVFQDGALVGMVTPGDVARVLSSLTPPAFRQQPPPPPPLPPAAEMPTPPRV